MNRCVYYDPFSYYLLKFMNNYYVLLPAKHAYLSVSLLFIVCLSCDVFRSAINRAVSGYDRQKTNK